MLRFLSLFLLCLSTLVSATELINGQWNGHPWNKRELIKKAESGDENAMAEWAYCSFYGENGIPYDLKKAFHYASEASRQGSIIGKSLEGFLYTLGDGVQEDMQKGIVIIDEAAKTKHPFARFIYAQNLNDSQSGRKDRNAAIALFIELEKENVALASALHGFFLKNSWSPIYNRQKADRVLKESFEKYNSTISTFLQYQDIDRVRRIYGPEYANKVTKRLHKSAKAGHRSSLRTLGTTAIKQEDYNTAVPYLLRAVELGDAQATNTLIKEIGSESDLPVTANFRDISKLASVAYRNGSRSETTVRRHIENLRITYCFGTPNKEASRDNILRLARKAIQDGDCNVHDELMRFYLHQALKKETSMEDFKRGIYHGIYHANHSKYNLYWCANYYLDLKNPELCKIPEGLVMAEVAIKDLRPTEKGYLTKKVAAAKKKATAEDLAKAEELRKAGYPLARKWRLEAFEQLKKEGFIDKDDKL